MANAYLSRANELLDEGASAAGAGDAPELEELLERNQQRVLECTEKAAQRMSYQAFYQEIVPWYWHRFQVIHGLDGTKLLLTRMKTLPDDTGDLESKRYAHISAVIELSDALTAAPEPIDAELAIRNPDGYTIQKANLENQAQSASAELEELMEQALTEYSRNLPVAISPNLSKSPDLHEQLTENPVQVGNCLVGFASPDRPDVDDHGPIKPEELSPSLLQKIVWEQEVCHYTAFVHDAQMHVISIGEPYPAGFPAEQVLEQMALAQKQLDASADEMSQEAYDKFAAAIVATEHAAEAGLHCLTPQAVNQFLDQARKMHMPRGVQRLLLEGLACYDSLVAERLLGDEADHNWHNRICGRQAGRRIIEAARQAGLDEYLLAEVAQMLGFSPQQLNVRLRPLGRRKMQALQQAARQAGIDSESWERMADNVHLDQEIAKLKDPR